MVSFRALRQTRLVIRFWITSLVWFKREKLCFVARLYCMFKVKIVMSQPILYGYYSASSESESSVSASESGCSF